MPDPKNDTTKYVLSSVENEAARSYPLHEQSREPSVNKIPTNSITFRNIQVSTKGQVGYPEHAHVGPGLGPHSNVNDV